MGYPSSELFPFEPIERAMTEALERHDSRALQYTDIAGLPELVDQLVTLSDSEARPRSAPT